MWNWCVFLSITTEHKLQRNSEKVKMSRPVGTIGKPGCNSLHLSSAHTACCVTIQSECIILCCICSSSFVFMATAGINYRERLNGMLKGTKDKLIYSKWVFWKRLCALFIPNQLLLLLWNVFMFLRFLFYLILRFGLSTLTGHFIRYNLLTAC